MVSYDEIAWAAPLARRYEEIREGHWWHPEGWGDWSIYVSIGEFDCETVCADAVKTLKGKKVDTFGVAWRVEPSHLFAEINDCLSELKGFHPDAEAGELFALPHIIPNADLLRKVKRDVRDLSKNDSKYCKAMGIIQDYVAKDIVVEHHTANTVVTHP